MTSLGTKTLCLWLIAGLLLLGCPVTGDAKISESSSEGAVITVALFATVLAVLFIIGFKSDMDNVFGQKAGRTCLAQSADEKGLLPDYESPSPESAAVVRWTF